jgi:hypothetical protein
MVDNPTDFRSQSSKLIKHQANKPREAAAPNKSSQFVHFLDVEAGYAKKQSDSDKHKCTGKKTLLVGEPKMPM